MTWHPLVCRIAGILFDLLHAPMYRVERLHGLYFWLATRAAYDDERRDGRLP